MLAVIYTRVSTHEQARDGLSLSTQLTECRNYATARRWPIVGEFEDVQSGLRSDRPGYQALLATIRRYRAEGLEVCVIVAALDRLGRKLSERVIVHETLRQLGVPVHSVREGGVLPDLVVNILASVAQEESQRLGSRVKAAAEWIRNGGWFAGGTPPLGYIRRPATEAERMQGAPRSVLAIDEEYAPIIVESFERVARGASLRSTWRWLNVKLHDSTRKRAIDWHPFHRMLRNRVYCGQLHDGRPGRWPAIVSEATWQQVQQRLTRQTLPTTTTTRRFLLTGFIFCGRCQRRMYGERVTDQKYRYRCESTTPPRHMLSGRRCDQFVLDAVTRLLEPWLHSHHNELESAWDALCQPDPAVQQQLERAQQHLMRIQRRLERLTQALIDDLVSKEEYRRMRAQLVREQQEMQAEVVRLQQQVQPTLPTWSEVVRRIREWRTVFHSAPLELQRETLSLLVARVVANSSRHIVIEWQPLAHQLHVALNALDTF